MSEDVEKKFVAFDIGGTLLIQDESKLTDFDRLLVQIMNGKSIEECAKYFGMEDVLAGIQSEAKGANSYYAGDRLREEMEANKTIAPDAVLEARIKAYELREPKMLKMIDKEYGKHVDLGIASNNDQSMHKILDKKLRDVGCPIDQDKRFLSTDSKMNGVTKASPEFYVLMGNGLYLPTNKILLVDDQQKMVDIAKEAGTKGTVYDKHGEKSLLETTAEGIEENLMEDR